MKDAIDKIRQHKRVKQILEHMMGPVGSIIFHILIVLLAIRLMVFTAEDKTRDIEVMVIEPDAVELEEFEKELEKIEELQETDLIAPPDVTMDFEAPAPDAPQPQQDVQMDLAALDVLSDAQSPLVMKGLYAGRGAQGRAASLGQYGGQWGKLTEAAVIKALEWLKKNQLPDGSWEPKSDAAAMTGLALLTFLAHGETPGSEKYGPTVEKAIRYLVSAQQENGAFCVINQHGVYEHAIATYAVSEAYGLTRIPSLKPVMENAVKVIIAGQQPSGAWDYFYKKESRKDLSVMGWTIQALKAASISGCEHPQLHEALEKAIECVKTFQNKETGKFGYTDDSAGPGFRDSLTGVAVLCLQLTGHGQDQAAIRGLQALKASDCKWNDPTDWPMYAWYYITQAKFQRGGSEWEAWNNRFAPEFVKNQQENGSWLNPAPKGRPESGMGPVYCTTLAALTLQVYYRFLPTFKPVPTTPPEKKDKSDEITVEII